MTKKNKDIKKITGLIGSGVTIGVGTQAVGAVGGNTAALTNLSGYYGTIGNVTGAGMVIDKLPKPKKKKY